MSIEESLGDSEARLHAHIENSPLAVVELDSEFRATAAARSGCRSAGRGTSLCCACATPAWAWTTTFRPHVILCDIGLPGVDGYAVARALLADPSSKPIARGSESLPQGAVHSVSW